jgi:isochorismate synthase
MRSESSNELITELSKHNEQTIVKSIFQSAVELKKSFAMWRTPDSSDTNIIVDLSGKPTAGKIELENSSPGFVLSPFINPANNHSLFINADLHYSSKEKSLTSSSTVCDKNEEAAFLELINKKIRLTSPPGSFFFSEYKNAEKDKTQFSGLVGKAIEMIVGNKLKKVVLSRSKKIKLKPSFDLTETYQALCVNYPDAFVSLVAIPGEGTWLGASPELLVCIDKNKIFKTSSLAGTQKLEKGLKLSGSVWTQKEIEEQALVTRYIINCFKTIRLREYEEEGPYTIQAGDLIHLKTDLSVDMKKVNFPDLGTLMLDLLHPTSAVCGMPKEEAMEFIIDHEGLNRSFFSGFLGPVNMAGETHIFVNLRCACILDKETAALYAGAGITKDSEAEKEWLETEMKMKTIGAFLAEEL